MFDYEILKNRYKWDVYLAFTLQCYRNEFFVYLEYFLPMLSNSKKIPKYKTPQTIGIFKKNMNAYYDSLWRDESFCQFWIFSIKIQTWSLKLWTRLVGVIEYSTF